METDLDCDCTDQPDLISLIKALRFMCMGVLGIKVRSTRVGGDERLSTQVHDMPKATGDNIISSRSFA